MREEERIYYFDNLKAFLIFLVVVGHVIDLTAYPSSYLRYIYYGIYFIHMPMFIFIMGFFSKNEEKCREEAFRKYLVPYVILVVISFLFSKYTGTLDEESKGLLRIFLPTKGCWFLWATFVWKVLLPELKKIRGIAFLSLIAGLFVGFSHEFAYKFSLSRITVFLFFFLCGYFTKLEQVEKIRRIPKVIPIVVLIVLGFANYYLAIIQRMPTESLLVRTYYRDECVWTDFFYRLIFYVVSSIFIFVLLCLFTNKKYKLTSIGNNTFYIYYLHLFIVKPIKKYCCNIEIFKENIAIYIIFVLVISAFTVYVLSRKIVKNIYNKIMDTFWNIVVIRE